MQLVTVKLSPLHALWPLSAAHHFLPPSSTWRRLQPMQGDLPFCCPTCPVPQAVQLHVDGLHQGPVGLCRARPPFPCLPLPVILNSLAHNTSVKCERMRSQKLRRRPDTCHAFHPEVPRGSAGGWERTRLGFTMGMSVPVHTSPLAALRCVYGVPILLAGTRHSRVTPQGAS